MPPDIHALEIEFAKNPSLDACLPLCDAYLAAKRYMEAMVVCKKGIKNATATDARGRVMLARVYLEQGKLPKAETELQQIMAEFPGSPTALELTGRLLIDQGKKPEAAAALQQALAADPSLTKARAWLGELGIAPTPPAAPAAAAPAAGSPAAAPPAARAAVAPPVRQGIPAAAPPRAGVPPPAAGAPPPAAAPAPAAATPAAGARPLEHVNDFFAPESLGFSGDSSGIETAGPGRLTILGFVPKNTGSLKTTALIFVAVIAGVSAWIGYQLVNSRNQDAIAKLYKQVKDAMAEDRYAAYKDAVAGGEKILKVDENHILTLSTMAYAEAVLAAEHREPGALEKAQELMARAMKSAKDENEYRIAGRALIAYLTKNYEKGLADIKALMDQNAQGQLIELEAFRLENASKPEDKDTKVELRRLVQSATSSARALDYLGWYYYIQDDWGKAGKFFDQTLQNAKGHPMSLLGRSLVALDQGLGLEQKQKDIEKDLKEVFATSDEQSQPVMAMAYFTRAQLERWQNNNSKADEDFRQAIKLDPGNALFSYRRGVALLKLGDAKAASEELRKVSGMDPNNPKYLKKLAEAQIKAQQLPEAKASLARVSQLDPNDYEVHLLEGALHTAQQDYDGAIKTYQAISREDGAQPFTLAQLAISEAMRQTGDAAKAIKHMEDFLAKIPENLSPDMQSRLWCELGQDYEANKNKAKATQSYQVGIEQYRYYPDCHFLLCRALGKGPESKEACKTYLTLDPRGRYVAEASRRVK